MGPYLSVVVVTMLASSAEDRVLVSLTCQTNDYRIGMGCYFAVHTTFSCISWANYRILFS